MQFCSMLRSRSTYIQLHTTFGAQFMSAKMFCVANFCPRKYLMLISVRENIRKASNREKMKSILGESIRHGHYICISISKLLDEPCRAWTRAGFGRPAGATWRPAWLDRASRGSIWVPLATWLARTGCLERPVLPCLSRSGCPERLCSPWLARFG